MNTKNQNMFWDVQVSIAKAVAAQEKPSLAKLHHDILEEIGQRPNEELIEYFLKIAKIPSQEKEEYFNYVGISKVPAMEITENLIKKSSTNPHIQIADNIACGDAPTVLKFRQVYSEEYGEPPSMKLIEYFLKKTQDVLRAKAEGGKVPSKIAFVEEVAAIPNSTVLKFRKSFEEQFGVLPTAELIEHFLKKLQKNSLSGGNEADSDDFTSSDPKVNFAKSAARQNIATILQFVKVFEKAYAEKPSVALIDVFIKNIPRTKKD